MVTETVDVAPRHDGPKSLSPDSHMGPSWGRATAAHNADNVLVFTFDAFAICDRYRLIGLFETDSHRARMGKAIGRFSSVSP